jgi:hypothetical protein
LLGSGLPTVLLAGGAHWAVRRFRKVG